MEKNVALGVPILREEWARDLPLPGYATEGSAGMDLRAAVKEPFVLEPGETAMIPTGLRVGIPAGYEAQIRPRSGLALKKKIGIPNAPGTIDSDYRGPLNVILWNFGSEPHRIERGDRIAQMVIAPVTRATWLETSHLDATTRGAGGFGHTGVQ